MKSIISFLALLGLVLGANAQVKPYCKLSGSVYESPTKQGSDFWVFEEESEAFADMLIFEEENKLYATEPGVWFFVENEGLADFKVFFTKEKSEADFIVYFVDSTTFAGCK
jgi:uncharacterized protein DUF6150